MYKKYCSLNKNVKVFQQLKNGDVLIAIFKLYPSFYLKMVIYPRIRKRNTSKYLAKYAKSNRNLMVKQDIQGSKMEGPTEI